MPANKTAVFDVLAAGCLATLDGCNPRDAEGYIFGYKDMTRPWDLSTRGLDRTDLRASIMTE